MFEDFETKLDSFVGGERLANIRVYYDFDWGKVIGHNRAVFRNGMCLAERVKRDCPESKLPALILTTNDEAKVEPIETPTHYAVVVRIKEYLSSPSYDPSAPYFADAGEIPLTKGALLKGVTDHPELVAQIVQGNLTVDMIEKWATALAQRWQQLKELVDTKGASSAGKGAKSKTAFDHATAAGALKWLAETDEVGPVLNKLAAFGPGDLSTVSSIVGIANLKGILKLWEKEKQNGDEDFWQGIFTSNPWVISQVFSYPVVIITGKAFVGGKAVDSTGGNEADFLYKNKITTSVMLVEIKTPTTKLLGSKYRKVYSISAKLSGAVNQILNYREEIEKNFYTIAQKSQDKFGKFNVISPKCLLVVGSLEHEQFGEMQRNSFEMFRSDLKSIEVITFDELFAKIELLVDLLEEK